MKKALIILSACIIVSPLLTTHATTVTTKKKQHKHKYDLKQEAAKPAAAASSPSTSGLSGSLAFTTNYIFRGVSNSENLPAVQGSLTYTFPIGIYLNLW